MLNINLTNKTRIVIISCTIITIIVFIVLWITRPQKISTPQTIEENISFPEDQQKTVTDIFTNKYKDIEKNIPPGSLFSIYFDQANPTIQVRINVKTLQEFYNQKKQISTFFLKFNINPCVTPFSHAIIWEATDWASIKPDANAQDDSCNDLVMLYNNIKSTNPLVQYLPYATDGFDIYYNIVDPSTFKISYIMSINIPVAMNTQLKTRQEVFDELQKQENLALDWIRLKGFDPATLDIRMPELDINNITTP